MRHMLCLSLFASALSAQAPTGEASTQATFDEAAFAADLAAILPGDDERAWRTLPWGTELRAAMITASEQRKPVLLWAMNGHPLGQT